MVKKHIKTTKEKKGGIVSKENFVHISNLVLTEKEKNGVLDSRVTWNFQKYLINKQGRVEKIISPRTRPDSEEIVSWITDVD